MRRTTLIAFSWTVLATAAFAHAGVKDPRVMAWMAGMKDMGADAKVLIQMSRGVVPFDAQAAETARLALAAEAERIVPLFAAKADDPKSESKPEIWTEFEEFSRLSTELEFVIAAADVSSADGIKDSARAIGAACAACHEAYRE